MCCSQCGEHTDNCDKCYNCGEHNDEWSNCPCCDFCDHCEELTDDCCCSEFGASEIAPWERRGENVKATTKKTRWELIWPDIDQGVDPVEAAATFYVLEALTAGVPAPLPGVKMNPVRFSSETDDEFFRLAGVDDPSDRVRLRAARNESVRNQRATDIKYHLQCLMGEAGDLLEELVEYLDGVFVAYSHMAIAGELRHHIAVGGKTLSNDRSSAWCGWRKVYDKIGNQALQDAATLFYEFTGGGYGGAPWANCAEVLYGRLEGKLGPDGPEGKINKRMFIDRIWTLEHNGGCFLNKIQWSVTNRKSWQLNHMRGLLDAHAAEPTDYKKLLRVADPDVMDLFNEYVRNAQSLQETLGLPVSENPCDEMNQCRKQCSACYADVEKGHYGTCGVMQNKRNFSFEPNDYKLEQADWFFVHDEEQHIGSALYEKSQKIKLPFNPEGVWMEDPNQQFKVDIALHINDANRGYETYSASKNATFMQLLSDVVKWHPKRFGKNSKQPLGKIHDYSVNISVWYAEDKDKNNPVFNFVETGYDVYGNDTAEWADKPISLSEYIKKQVGTDWCITSPSGLRKKLERNQ